MHPRFEFPTDDAAILHRLETWSLDAYSKTRNDLNGAVTAISPYLTHGVISLPQVRQAALKQFSANRIRKFLDELLWREFFHRVWQARSDDIFSDLRGPQSTGDRTGVPRAISEGKTGIRAIDEAITSLYETGYVHNHARMWLAAVACHQARCHWPESAAWFYYHLLDGDLASNTLSWQWVAGSFSNKIYVANQENLNRFAGTNQSGTFLDVPYGVLDQQPIPEVLSDVLRPTWSTPLQDQPSDNEFAVPDGANVLLYHPWSLDPGWRANETAHRVLIFEPSHFERFPMSRQRVEFILGLARNVKGLQVFVGEVDQLPGLDQAASIRSREYPATHHWPGERDEREWLFPQVDGYYRSYSAFKKRCLREHPGSR